GLSGPCGMSLDSAGALYVANTGGGNVNIYPARTSSPSLTLRALNIPTRAEVDSTGNVWGSNRSASHAGILVYKPGNVVPSQVIQSSLITNIVAEAFDAGGDLYFGDFNTGVSEIPVGTTQPVSLGLKGPVHTDGLTVDPI